MKVKPKVDYSIEYCHIYLDEPLNSLHERSIEKLKEWEKVLEEKGKSYNRCIFIDNYNPSNSILTNDKISNFLKSQEAFPDFFVYESDTSKLSNFVLEHMNPKEKREYLKYISDTNTVPCSLNIVIWYLVRFGLLDNNTIYEKIPSVASHLVTIIPERFKEVERKAIKVLKNSAFSGVINDIEYEYIEDAGYAAAHKLF